MFLKINIFPRSCNDWQMSFRLSIELGRTLVYSIGNKTYQGHNHHMFNVLPPSNFPYIQPTAVLPSVHIISNVRVITVYHSSTHATESRIALSEMMSRIVQTGLARVYSDVKVQTDVSTITMQETEKQTVLKEMMKYLRICHLVQ